MNDLRGFIEGSVLVLYVVSSFIILSSKYYYLIFRYFLIKYNKPTPKNNIIKGVFISAHLYGFTPIIYLYCKIFFKSK